MSAVVDAIEAFWDYLASVQPLPLGIAICCHIAKTMCTSRAWRNVLAAAYPETRVRWISIYGAYIAGVGVNAILPARAGDVVRLTMAHRAVKGATYTTLVSSSLVLAIVDVVCGVSLFAWAMTQGVLPSFDVLPSLPSFDFRWLFEHDRVGEIVLLAVVFGLIGLAIWVSAHVAEFQERVGQAFTILHTPLRWFRSVALWQLGDWALRLTTIWFMLDAFGIDQSRPQRAPRAGLAEPRHPPAGQPRRRRHRAGVPRLHAAGRRAASSAPGLQRRHAADPDGRQRRARLHRHPADAPDAANPQPAAAGRGRGRGG